MLVFKRGFASSSVLNKNYGFIGLGRMGLNMARNIESKMKPEDSLYIYDVNSSSMDEFTGKSTFKSKTPLDVAQNSDITITMLPEGKHVKKVYDEISKLKVDDPTSPGKIFIDSSTIDVKTSIETAKLLKDNRIGNYVDAPVSGGVLGAKNGTLTFMVGSKDLTPFQSTLDMMGKRAFSCGEAGSGISVKLCNNYLLALNNIATAEAFQLAKRLNLDLSMFSKVVNISTGKCWPSEVNNPVPGVDPNTPSSNDYNGGFGVALMNKDFNLALDAARLVDCPLPISEKAADIYDTVYSDPEYKNKDMSIVYKWLDGKYIK